MGQPKRQTGRINQTGRKLSGNASMTAEDSHASALPVLGLDRTSQAEPSTGTGCRGCWMRSGRPVPRACQGEALRERVASAWP